MAQLVKPTLFSLMTLSCLSSFSALSQDAASGPEAQSCPADFYALPLFPGARMCQVFAEDLPATMTYHADAQQEETKAFFIQQMGEAQDEKHLKGRILLEYQDGNQIIVISKDGNGSQVDVLVKA